MVKDVTLFSVSAGRYPVFPATFVEEAVVSASHVLGTFVKLGGCSCMDSYLGLLFCSTALHICFCASTLPFLLLWLDI
jgi:hypothetical protein